MATSTTKRASTPTSSDPLIGLRFLTLNEKGGASQQGKFIALVSPGIYLVELCDWLCGAPSEMRIMPLSEFVTAPSDENNKGAVIIDDDYDISVVWRPYEKRNGWE